MQPTALTFAARGWHAQTVPQLARRLAAVARELARAVPRLTVPADSRPHWRP
jgi:hypothetical protein